jgi:hypothetical protein
MLCMLFYWLPITCAQADESERARVARETEAAARASAAAAVHEARASLIDRVDKLQASSVFFSSRYAFFL